MKLFNLLGAAFAAVSASLLLYQPAMNAAVPTHNTKDKVEEIVKAAGKAEMKAALPMTIDNVKASLGKYVTRSFEERFIRERMVKITYGKDKGKWFVPGSDDMYLYVPNFSWDYKTRVNRLPQEKIAVSERFAGQEGPWITEPHVETVVLKKENGDWKVNDILYKNSI